MPFSELQLAFQHSERAGNFQRALRIAQRIYDFNRDPEVQAYYGRAIDRLRRLIDRVRLEAIFPKDSTSLERKLGFPNRPESSNMVKYPQEPRAPEPVVNVRQTKNGLCECPPRTIGYLKKAPIQLRELLAERTTNMITRYQSLSTPDTVCSLGALVTRLNCVLNNAVDKQETAMPFFIYSLGVLPQLFDKQTPAGGTPADVIIRPKVVLRLFCRNAPYHAVTNINGYSYSDDPAIDVQPMFYFKAVDDTTFQNAPDLVTNQAANVYNFEWTTGAVTSVPKIKKLYHMWSEVQWLIKDMPPVDSPTDHTNITTGFIKFPKHMEPPHFAYNSNLTADNVVYNTPMSAEEAIAYDSFWTRYFNKDMSHPLMRSGLANKSDGPYMHHTRRHCLEQGIFDMQHPDQDLSQVKVTDRYNFNAQISYLSEEEVANAVPAQTTGSFYQAKYLQSTGSNGYGGWPDFGRSNFAFITSSKFGSPALPETYAANHVPSFDVMIRNRLTYASPF